MSENSDIKASVIIPTYNRCESLLRALASLSCVDFAREYWEVVVVDNHSTDGTRQTVESAIENLGLNITYVREDRLSFTVARHAGSSAARGKYLLYIDDDVTVEKEWLAAIVNAFEQDPQCGMAGGPVRPAYEAPPPEWVSLMDPIWLSLFDLGNASTDVLGVPGPNLCVRKSVLDEVGGFPPDTIGVESSDKPGTVEKIYIGPGDWGLSQRVRARGYKIRYVPEAAVLHHIPPVRLTKKWWHSRLAGEGCYLALTAQYENPQKSLALLGKSVYSAWITAKTAIRFIKSAILGTGKERYEFQISFHASEARVELALARRPDLARRLWDIALTGVSPQDIKELIRLLP